MSRIAMVDRTEATQTPKGMFSVSLRLTSYSRCSMSNPVPATIDMISSFLGKLTQLLEWQVECINLHASDPFFPRGASSLSLLGLTHILVRGLFTAPPPSPSLGQLSPTIQRVRLIVVWYGITLLPPKGCTRLPPCLLASRLSCISPAGITYQLLDWQNGDC